MIYKVEIVGKFYNKTRNAPGWNDRISATGRHYQQGGSMEREYLMVCANAIRHSLKKTKITKPIKITYIFHEADRKRDLGNIAFIDKPFEDALQRTNVLPNDNQNYVRELHFILGEMDKNNPHIEVFLEEIE